MGVSVDSIALVVAFVALVIAVLQVVQQYASSSSARGKVNTASIGLWSKKNKFRWSFWEWKLRVSYARISLRTEDAIDSLIEQRNRYSELLNSMPHIQTAQYMEVADGPLGPRVNGMPKLKLYRRDQEGRGEVALRSLPWRERRQVAVAQKMLELQYARTPPRKATWYNLMVDVGLDMDHLPSDGYLDAETIPSSIDSPTMQIHLSDLIQFGVLMHMKIVSVDEYQRDIQMTGRHCNISTRYQEGVGQLSRYSGLAPHIQPQCRVCSPPELKMCLRTASGVIQVGDAMASMTDWGYNSVELVMRAARGKSSHSDWQEISIKEVMAGLEGDSDAKWGGRWTSPTVPPLPFILSICGSMAVANSFPHTLLTSWTQEERRKSCKAAMAQVQATVGFVEIPSTAFDSMRKGDNNLLVTDDFKVANNYGCEFGGLRSWVTCNLSEFTYRFAQCWPVEGVTDSVPILARLHNLLRDGTLDRKWCEEYDQDAGYSGVTGAKNATDSGDHWRMTAAPLLWLQITMLDSWIGRRADMIVDEHGREEVSVPTDIYRATLCAQKALNLKPTTGWKQSRMDFTLLYLRCLADGAGGKATSCMSPEPRAGEETAGWDGMSCGTPRDWAAIDAVLTLRAFLLHLRLELMNDSSVLLRLRRFDPVVNLA
ncbi:hypothetical protein OE88DRAFT_235379 [Heliocybe sulcata]|uniref:Uncharacterized protein n=1 Tax=Heliocybe sulcata TaxID=5364 RepID=A0A5C3MZV1_9AGAM|nr:hypothetical protein OE88DRAFT_235379 [Heliocybe sulcata]